MKSCLTLIGLALLSVCASGQVSAVGTPIKLHIASGTSTGTSLAYTPTGNSNTVIIGGDLQTAASGLTATDGTTSLTLGGTTPTANSRIQFVFTLCNLTNTTHTAYAVNWTGSANGNFWLQEYSGNTGGCNTTVTASSTTSGSTCSGAGCTSSAATTSDISIVLDDANDWMVCLMSDGGNAMTMTVGNQRLNETNSPEGILGDNTASSGAVHCTATIGSAILRMLAVELRVSGNASAITLGPNMTVGGSITF